MDRPDRVGRVAILKVHMARVKVGATVDPDQIAALTPGFTGADLANLVNEAALSATRRKADAVERQDFDAAIERIVAGLEKKNRLLNPREREIVAFHEMGHALAAAATTGVDPVHKVSIIPRGIGALGLHDAAAHRGPVPDDARGARGKAGGAARRPVRGGAGLRAHLDRRGGRPVEGHRHRAEHGHAVRDGSGARAR